MIFFQFKIPRFSITCAGDCRYYDRSDAVLRVFEKRSPQLANKNLELCYGISYCNVSCLTDLRVFPLLFCVTNIKCLTADWRQYGDLHTFFFMAQQPLMGQGLLIIEASLSHSDTPHSIGLLWTSDQPDAETST